MLSLEQKEKADKEVFDLKLATYGADPERYAEAVFPEWYSGTSDLDSLDEYESVIFDLEADDEMMTPAKMERMLAKFQPQK